MARNARKRYAQAAPRVSLRAGAARRRSAPSSSATSPSTSRCWRPHERAPDHGAQLERLCEHLLKLRLFKSRERLEALLQHAAAKELAYSDFLEQVLAEEVAAKTSKNVTMRTRWRASRS